MLDLLIPIHFRNLDLAINCISALMEKTDVPFKVIAMVDGGNRSDVAMLEGLLKTIEKPNSWALVQLKPGSGFNRAFLESMELSKNDWVALVAPEIVVDDREWFGKMQMAFIKDPTAYMIDSAYEIFEKMETRSSTIPPVRRSKNKLAKNCRFFLSRKHTLRDARKVINMASGDLVADMERAAMNFGGSVWCHGGIKFHLQDGEEHRCQERSVEATPSRSLSQTTPD